MSRLVISHPSGENMKIIIFSAVLVVLSIYRPCIALTSEEYNKLAELWNDQKYCESLPESNLITQCQQRRQTIKETCKQEEGEGHACTFPANDVRQLRSKQGKLSGLADSDAELKEKLKREVEDLEQKLKKDKETFEAWSKDWGRCAAAREEQMKIFEEGVRISVYDAEHHTETREAAGQMHVRYATGIDEHKKEKTNAENAKKNCDNAINQLP